MKTAAHLAEYGATVAAAWCLRRAGLAPSQALGRAVGRAAFALGMSRPVALANLERRLGLGDPSERRRVAREAYASMGQTMAELAYTPALALPELDAMYTFEGLGEIEAVRAAGKGVVCLSAHFGNWEWMAAALARKGFPVTVLVGTQTNPYVDRLLNGVRVGAGVGILRIQDVRGAARVLRGRGVVALLGDQDGDRWGTFVPFFGEEASTHNIAEMLARLGNAEIAFGVDLRTGPRTHLVRVGMLPAQDPALPPAQAAARVLAEYNRRLEAEIRAHPGQWLWMHRRWKSKAFHRISGADRARAEAGEIFFDMDAQTWRETAGGAPLKPEGWR